MFGPSPSCPRISLNIYDLGQEEGIQWLQWLNGLFANYYSPVKFGGMFHVGVQIGETEWAFGYAEDGSGVYSTPPRSSRHHFNQNLEMPPTKFSEQEIENLIAVLRTEWSGSTYRILDRNCCHFADALCQRLEIGGIPSWTYRDSLLFGKLSINTRKEYEWKNSFWMRPALGNYFEVGVGSKIFFFNNFQFFA